MSCIQCDADYPAEPHAEGCEPLMYHAGLDCPSYNPTDPAPWDQRMYLGYARDRTDAPGGTT